MLTETPDYREQLECRCTIIGEVYLCPPGHKYCRVCRKAVAKPEKYACIAWDVASDDPKESLHCYTHDVASCSHPERHHDVPTIKKRPLWACTCKYTSKSFVAPMQLFCRDCERYFWSAKYPCMIWNAETDFVEPAPGQQAWIHDNANCVDKEMHGGYFKR
jgi:hypothetical protein